MSKKRLTADEIIELLKISVDGIPNFAPILEKGTIAIIREVNDRTIKDVETASDYNTKGRKPKIIEFFAKALTKRLQAIQAHDIPLRREEIISKKNGTIIARRYYDELTREWLNLHRLSNEENYNDQYITRPTTNELFDTPTVPESPEIIDVEASEISEVKAEPATSKIFPLNYSQAAEELKKFIR